MARRSLTAAVGLCLAMAGVAVPSPAVAGPGGGATAGAGVVVETAGEGTGLWIVQLADPPLASYAGGVAGLAPTSPRVTGATRLDVTAPASRAYTAHLARRQEEFIDRMRREIGRDVEVQFTYRNAVNGVAVRVDEAQARALARMPGVAAVYRDVVRELDTDVSHGLIGSASVWTGDTGTGVGTRGEGIVVGVIDTGINPHHPSFAATDAEGYTHTNPYGSGTYVGVCDPSHPQHEDICNDKLIGAWNFHPASPTAQDVNGHGSHTAATVAGNVHEAVFTVDGDRVTRTVQGVAPRANIISYLVCFPSCPSSSSVAAVDQAIADGVDVLNYSISGADNPWIDIVDLAFLEAFNAGIFVAASAGNDGPGAGTVAKTGPWNASVAATTHARVFANRVEVTGPQPVPPQLTQMWAVPGTGPALTSDLTAEIRYAGQVAPGNERGCAVFPAGSFDGVVALVERGDCTFEQKVGNAAAAGAVAVAVVNQFGGPPVSMAQLEATTIPAVMLDLTSGTALRDHILATAPQATTVRLHGTAQTVTDAGWQDVVAGFSSRGPSRFELLAPTFAAPGVNILAASAAADGDARRYEVMQGTSMASPHAAGAGALLAALHPDWSPAEIRSALAGTAVTDGVLAEDGTTPADPLAIGSGRIDLDRAGRVGLVMDETYANFVAANPATGGDPKTLNLPAMVDNSCAGTCSWTRTVESVVAGEATYTAVAAAPPGMTVTVTPSEFTLVEGAAQTVSVTVEVDTDVLPAGRRVFADVRFVTDATHPGGRPVADVHYPVVVVPQPAPPEEPSVTVQPRELTSTQASGEVVTLPLTIGNEGTVDLTWHVTDTGPTATPRRGATVVAAADPAGAPARGGASLASDRRAAAADGPAVVVPERSADRTAGRALDQAGGTPDQEGPVRTLTHSQSQAVVGGVAVACSPDQGFTTTENAFLRTFTLTDFDITGGFDVQEVEFGVESLTVAASLTVNLYTLVDPEGQLVDDNLRPIGSATRVVQPRTLSRVTVPVTGHAEAGSTLVVEVAAPDLSGVGGFWPGANGAGQTAPSYFRSASCGFPQPVDLAAIGFPGVHLVMNVTGLVEPPACEAPTGTPWVEVDPTAGVVPPGGEQQVAVTFDATGVDPGTYLATLCLATDDPARSVVVVPLTMVVEEPDIDLDVRVRFERGWFYADLTWTGVGGGDVDVHRDGQVVATVPDTGAHTDTMGRPRDGAAFTYQVCRAGTTICSPERTVVADRRDLGGLRPPPVRITTTTLPELHVLRAYQHTLTATGGTGAYVWTATGLPDGLVLDWQTGTLRNDPTDPAVTDATGPVEVTVTVSDAGDPRFSDSRTFQLEVVGVDQVAAGWGHTCAVAGDATAYCWGRNATGQIGNGVVGGDGVHVPLPTQVLDPSGTGPLTGVVRIAGGDGHTCALTHAGTVYCWGANFDGRLGTGEPTLEPQPLPQQVVAPDGTGPLTGVADIAVGGQFACAVTVDGGAYCWGNNSFGKLGIGSLGGSQPRPVPVSDPTGTGTLTGVTALAAGSNHACAVAEGVAYCWGVNFQGQLGNGGTGFAEPLPVPVRDPDGAAPLSDVVAVSAGAAHTCALAASEEAYCWGSNLVGQLGDGTGVDRLLPVRVRDGGGSGPLTGVTGIVAGDNHTCATGPDGAVLCWGSNFYGQLGDGQPGTDRWLPVVVRDRDGEAAFTGAVTVTAGNGHTCALTSRAVVYCWGANFNRQLGIGDTPDDHLQVRPEPVRPGPPVT